MTKKQFRADLHKQFKETQDAFNKHLNKDSARSSCWECNRYWGALHILGTNIVKFGGKITEHSYPSDLTD